MQQIADWLKKLGMSEYADRFAEERIEIDALSELTDQDLERLHPAWSSPEDAEGDPGARLRSGYASSGDSHPNDPARGPSWARDRVVDRAGDEGDAFLEQPRIFIVGTLAAVGLFDHHRD
jgi:SAM domain (Sterile alpha motif)